MSPEADVQPVPEAHVPPSFRLTSKRGLRVLPLVVVGGHPDQDDGQPTGMTRPWRSIVRVVIRGGDWTVGES